MPAATLFGVDRLLTSFGRRVGDHVSQEFAASTMRTQGIASLSV